LFLSDKSPDYVFKGFGFAYTSLKAIIREFEFVGLIYSITKINDNSQAYKEYYIKEKKEKNG